MLLNILIFLTLGCNAIIVSSDCPKSQEWRNMRISSRGPLVCARLYGDEKCSGFPLPFGVNSSSSDLGTESSSPIDFVRNNVTALVRPGCNMFLWEGANFTGRLEKSSSYTWNIDRRSYSSVLCNCSVDDVELLQCELREDWEELSFCDFRESDIGGLCSVTLKRSYIVNEDAENVTITENLANLFAGKIFESFGVKRMATFLDVNFNDKLAHSILVEAWNGIKIKQRFYVCGKYHLFTPEVVMQYERKYDSTEVVATEAVSTEAVPACAIPAEVVPAREKWIYNQNSNSCFWFSSTKENYSTSKDKCRKIGGQLANLRLDTIGLTDWIQPLLASIPYSEWWFDAGPCTSIKWLPVSKMFHYKTPSECELTFNNYICERNHV